MTQEVLEPREVMHSRPEPRTQVPKKRRGYLLVTVVAIVLAVAAIVGVLSRISDSHALAKETDTLAVQSVSVIRPKPEPPQQELVLPSTLQAYTESPIYARTNGYLAKWYKDIGSKVTKGELLAEIETPEVDQELAQSRAAQEQANAQLALAKTSAQRWANLQKMDAVAQQETDERTSTYTQGQAALAAATANVRRLEQLESFKRVYAPFSGIRSCLTSRVSIPFASMWMFPKITRLPFVRVFAPTSCWQRWSENNLPETSCEPRIQLTQIPELSAPRLMYRIRKESFSPAPMRKFISRSMYRLPAYQYR
jgi:hypothetical protein